MLVGAALAAIGGFGAADRHRPNPYPHHVDGGWTGHVVGRHMVAQHVISGKPWKRGKPVRIRRREAFHARRRGNQMAAALRQHIEYGDFD